MLERFSRIWAQRGILLTLVQRDLRVRYARSWLGYLWTIIDPLAMALIYFVVFAVIFQRGDAGHKPYFLFLLLGILVTVFVFARRMRKSGFRLVPSGTGSVLLFGSNLKR